MILDFSRLDTRPGAEGPHGFLAPPADFSGSGKDYAAWAKACYDNDNAFRQRVVTASLHWQRTFGRMPVLEGPFAGMLQRMLEILITRRSEERNSDAREQAA